ncbi:hypothetical protein J2R71_009858 [Bradyrhizobium japonicum]|nr:hypothetical protein [Bradyrhizobium japonicum]
MVGAHGLIAAQVMGAEGLRPYVSAPSIVAGVVAGTVASSAASTGLRLLRADMTAALRVRFYSIAAVRARGAQYGGL